MGLAVTQKDRKSEAKRDVNAVQGPGRSGSGAQAESAAELLISPCPAPHAQAVDLLAAFRHAAVDKGGWEPFNSFLRTIRDT